MTTNMTKLILNHKDYKEGNEDLDEHENQEANTAIISDDHYFKGKSSGDYIYALLLDVACAA